MLGKEGYRASRVVESNKFQIGIEPKYHIFLFNLFIFKELNFKYFFIELASNLAVFVSSTELY
jgi:hypothetical protein